MKNIQYGGFIVIRDPNQFFVSTGLTIQKFTTDPATVNINNNGTVDIVTTKSKILQADYLGELSWSVYDPFLLSTGGPQGTQGIQGLQGIQGIQGTQGLQGTTRN